MRRLIEDRHLLASLIAGAVAFVLLFALMVRAINPYDEGIVLTGALRTLSGDIPHRDYYSTYGPGQNDVLAVLFVIFGKSLLVARLFSLAVISLIASMAFALTLGRMRWYFSLFVLALACTFLFTWQAHLYPIYPVILLAMTGSLALLRNPSRPCPWLRPVQGGGCALSL
jgi:hypothetical protein